MERYIALLRGINISGKNQVSMPELKSCFAEEGYTDVITYLNSGNVVFSDHRTDPVRKAKKIEAMIRRQFSLDIPVFVILQKDLQGLLEAAPDWWGTEDKAIYDNLIFVLPPHNAEAIQNDIGDPSEGLERILIKDNVIFWSFDRKNYAKANWWKKTGAAGIGEKITIRTAGTVRKTAQL